MPLEHSGQPAAPLVEEFDLHMLDGFCVLEPLDNPHRQLLVLDRTTLEIDFKDRGEIAIPVYDPGSGPVRAYASLGILQLLAGHYILLATARSFVAQADPPNPRRKRRRRRRN